MGFMGQEKNIAKGIGGLGAAMTQKNNFQGTPAPIIKQDFMPYIAYEDQLQKAAVEQQNAEIAQQQNLAQALQAQMEGRGPNPAQEQYKQNVNQNIQQAAGMVASQKGISPALATRMIGQQYGAAQQGAAGNQAVLQAQQQLAATGQLQNQQGMIANERMGQGSQALQGQGIYQNAQAAQNQSINASYGNAQDINANVAASNVAQQNAMTGRILGGAGSAAAMMMAKGGAVPMKQGGHVPGKAQVSGDSQENDTVHAMLSPGEIVVPRTLAKDPERAKEFIKHINQKKEAKGHGYGDVLMAKKKRKALEEA